MSTDQFCEFEVMVVLRIKQRGADASDASSRAQASLAGVLRDKELLPEPHMRSDRWDDSLATRVQHDRFGCVGQVLTVTPTGVR